MEIVLMFRLRRIAGRRTLGAIDQRVGASATGGLASWRTLFALLPLAALGALLLPGVADAHLSVLRPSPSDAVTFHGHGGYSTDGGYPGSVVRAEVPAGSTVEQAYLYGTYATYSAQPMPAPQRTIDFDGTNVEMTEIENDGGILPSTRADVTPQVAAKVQGGGGITSFGVDSSPSSIQGVALVVIYSNPSSPLESIAVLDGAASSAGDTATLNFAAPLNTATPGFSSTMAIGDGYSYQGAADSHSCGPVQQDSWIKVNEALLTSCAGGDDDGSPNFQYLITVGGIGDSTNDPSNPSTTTEGTEDELYSLTPFLHNGDTQLTIQTANPSGDDDLFLAVIAITANASAGIGNESAPPAAGEPPAVVSPPLATSTGGPKVSGTITGQKGTYSGAESYAYQWQLCSTNEASSCTNIVGANGVEYTPGPSDAGGYLRFVVTAVNTTGSTVASSALVGPVGAAAPATALSVTIQHGVTIPHSLPEASVSPVCTSKRIETIHWRTRRGVHLKHILITLNGNTLYKLGGRSHKAVVSLIGRGPGAARVLIEGTSATGAEYRALRTYEPCIPGKGRRRLRSTTLAGRR
jgi:hypothetical protein